MIIKTNHQSLEKAKTEYIDSMRDPCVFTHKCPRCGGRKSKGVKMCIGCVMGVPMGVLKLERKLNFPRVFFEKAGQNGRT